MNELKGGGPPKSSCRLICMLFSARLHRMARKLRVEFEGVACHRMLDNELGGRTPFLGNTKIPNIGAFNRRWTRMNADGSRRWKLLDYGTDPFARKNAQKPQKKLRRSKHWKRFFQSLEPVSKNPADPFSTSPGKPALYPTFSFSSTLYPCNLPITCKKPC
jgi:hypothetical protein